MIDWMAFLIVLLAALVGTIALVTLYSIGLRFLVAAGRVPVVIPAEFDDAITVYTKAEIKQAEKRAAKAARKNPLSPGAQKAAYVAAWASFTLCAIGVLFGIYLIVPALHG